MIFSWPGQIQAGLQSHALVELLDKSATLLELAGVPVPDYFQGKSLLPILQGKAAPEHHRDFVRCEYYDALDAAFVGTGSPDKPNESPDNSKKSQNLSGVCPPVAVPTGTFGTMYRDKQYKISVYHGHNVGELYDLDTDPWEFDNLWDDPNCQSLKCDLLLKNFDAP